eukprot:TRINITY_DN3989_c0_g1_i1.p1 TRINITY_DN3989_c0_g1~~TRINITY_DN3989_c0_g1_i1.p1  ORF type:complete len:144 (-),score=42.50 TRINITY_DN3989_c0_g1_i1:42-473(-)
MAAVLPPSLVQARCLDEEGRLIKWPGKKQKQMLLTYLADSCFVRGRVYENNEVDAILRQVLQPLTAILPSRTDVLQDEKDVREVEERADRLMNEALTPFSLTSCPDYVTLKRELVESGLLERAGDGQTFWRTERANAGQIGVF